MNVLPYTHAVMCTQPQRTYVLLEAETKVIGKQCHVDTLYTFATGLEVREAAGVAMEGGKVKEEGGNRKEKGGKDGGREG